MKRLHYILLVAAPLIFSGCGLYSHYSRPDLSVDIDSLYRKTVADDDFSSMTAVPWRDFFTDAHLRTLIDSSLNRNTDLAIALLKVEEAQAALFNARLSYLPSLNLNPQAGISYYDGEAKKTFNIGAAASWEIDIFGRVTNAKRGAEASLHQSVSYAQAVHTNLVATVADCYYTLLMLDEQLAIANATLSNWDETIAALEALVQAGKSNDVAVRQARANRAALDAAALNIRQSISETENTICALLKEPPHTIDRGTLDEQTFPDGLSVGVPLALLSNRPDVMQAEAALAEAFYATNIARAAFYPNITLSGSLGWTNNGSQIINPGSWLSSSVASLVTPLFNMGSNIANLRIAQAKQNEALLQFEQTLLNAGNEVNNAITQWQTASQRIALDQMQIDELNEAAEKTQLLMRYSSATYIEVLTAQQSLLNARQTLAQDRVGKIQAAIRLYHALGGGLD